LARDDYHDRLGKCSRSFGKLLGREGSGVVWILILDDQHMVEAHVVGVGLPSMP